MRGSSKSPKIALVSFSPFFHAGGGEQHALECLRRWLHTTTGVFYTIQSQQYGLEAGGIGKHVRMHVLLRSRDGGNPIIRILANVNACFRLPRELDAVLSVTHYIFDFIPALVTATRTRCKLVLYVHHLFSSPFEVPRGFLHSCELWLSQRIVLLLARKRLDLVFTPASKSTELRRWLPDAKIASLSNGVSKLAVPSYANVKFQGCFIGRIAREKGVDDLLDIWSKVVQEYASANLVIIGIGSDRSIRKLHRAIKRLGLERNVRYFGSVGESAKFGILRRSACFLFPSYEEGWGIAVTEALASGVPVVAYDLPAYRPFADAIVTVPLRDKNRFSARVIELLRSGGLRKRIMAKEVRISRQFDWDSIAKCEWSHIKATWESQPSKLVL